MIWIDATIHFIPGKLSPEFLGIYRDRYRDTESGWTAASWDDTAETLRRRAAIPSNVAPIPSYGTQIPSNLAEFTDAWRATNLTGHSITLGWPENFIADIQRTPQPEPELFTGITILQLL